MPTHYRTCNLCEAMCGLVIQYENQTVLDIRGDQADPFSRGHICPKAVALKDIYEDPDRLKQPVKRTDDGWVEISWEQAYEEVVNGLQQIKEKYGRDSIAVYQGNPNVHNVGSMLFGPDFVRSLRTKYRYSATSADQLPHHFAGLLMFGHYFLLPVPDIDRTDFLLIFGGNPLVSNGSIMSAPDMANRLKAIQKRGGKIVLIDPRKTETAKKADAHYFIPPGRDVLLLLAMIHTVFREDWDNLRHLADFTDGVEDLKNLVSDYAPEKVADLVGIAVTDIVQLTKEFCEAESAVCYGRLGVSTQAFGGLCQWLVNALNIVTGNFDRAGGMMFSQPAIDTVAQTAMMGRKGKMGRWTSDVRQLVEFAGELPVSTMAEDMLEADSSIKGMVTIAGNPVLSTPNGKQLDQALEQMDFMVSIDIYLNETTRHANIILPPTTGLETMHYDLVFHILAIRNSAKYSAPLFEKTADQRHDWEIFTELVKRMTGTAPNGGMSPEMILQFGLQMGTYSSKGVSLEALKKNPHGIDLGPLQPCLPQRLFTTDKRIQLAPTAFVEDTDRVATTFFSDNQTDNDFPLALIGRRHLRSNNSWMHNSHRLVKGRNRCTLLMHPKDAEALDISNNQLVIATSRIGSIVIKAEISDEIMEGVVSIPHGWGHNRENTQMSVANRYAGVSINDLTDHLLIDPLTGNAAFNGVPVRVSRALN